MIQNTPGNQVTADAMIDQQALRAGNSINQSINQSIKFISDKSP